MTGFGRAEGLVNDRKVTVELRSLNSKQLDLSIKMPASIKEHEPELRPMIGELVLRGKVDCFITIEGGQAGKRSAFDVDLVKSYHAELLAIREQVEPNASTDLLAHVLRMPEVTVMTSDRFSDAEWFSTEGLVRAALEAFEDFRRSEGRRLSDELRSRVQGIEELLAEVERSDAGRLARTRERLESRLAEFQVQVDRDRFDQELIYYLEKMDITEEKVRLGSHCAYFKETMEQADPQGRKLAFIAQEMGREINTLGSKANDAAMQQQVVRMKDELEKVKEQVLNVL